MNTSLVIELINLVML